MIADAPTQTGLDRSDLDLVLESIRDFSAEALPDARLLELDHADEFPEETVRDLCGEGLGIHLLFIPEAYGGMGGSTTDVYRVCEALGRVDLALSPAGFALVSWLHEREGTAALMLAAIDPAGDRTVAVVEQRVDGGRSTGFPRLALLDDEVVLAWTRPGAPAGIRAVSVPLALWCCPSHA